MRPGSGRENLTGLAGEIPTLRLHRPRFKVWWMMIAVAVTAIIIDLLLPLSAADRR